MDTTLNDGFTSNKELDNYKKKADIYNLGIKAVKKFIKEYQVDCDWNECGKFFASSNLEDKKILKILINKIISDYAFTNGLDNCKVAIISSVVPNLNTLIKNVLKQNSIKGFVIRSKDVLPFFKIRYDLKEIGADRLAN